MHLCIFDMNANSMNNGNETTMKDCLVHSAAYAEKLSRPSNPGGVYNKQSLVTQEGNTHKQNG